ncbi:MAG: hypothetical protein H6744_13610 [Deltaproteobacteria bacterium]|nr:hypothetical protein [Deltaproteobacteria bacterium]
MLRARTEAFGPRALQSLDLATGEIEVLHVEAAWTDITRAPHELVEVPELGLLFFVANDGTTGQELWRTDGTPGGTFRLGDFSDSPDSPEYLTAFQGKLYYSNRDVDHGQELWVSDGTAVGTQMAEDILVGTASGQPSGLIVIGDLLYFAARFDPPQGEAGLKGQLEPHIYDGDIVTRLGDFNGEFGSGPTAFLPVSNPSGTWTVYYGNDDDLAGTSGTALMRINDTASKTERIAFFEPYAFAGAPPATNGAFWFFGATTAEAGGELWRTDGTPEGTVLVEDIRAGALGAGLSGLRGLGDRVCFVADDGTHGASCGAPRASRATPT